MQVLLSIKPVHVASILSGIKRFEFRRKIFARRDVRSVLIYSTQPVGQLVAEFEIEEILEDDPVRIWARTHKASGISKAYFDDYFKGRKTAYALAIGALTIFEHPIEPRKLIQNFTPPQSFRYVNRSVCQLAVL